MFLKNLFNTKKTQTPAPVTIPNLRLSDSVLIPCRSKSGLFGYCNKNKQIIVSCHYDEVEPFGKYPFGIVTRDEKKGLISSIGALFTPCIYDQIRLTTQSPFIEVWEGKCAGLLSIKG